MDIPGTTILLLVGAVLSLLKGFDWEEACLLTFTAALLALFRRSFYRPSRLLELPDCAHSPHRDQPDAVVAAAVAFIQAHHTTA